MSGLSARTARAALTGDFDKVSPRRLAHFARADAQLAPDSLMAAGTGRQRRRLWRNRRFEEGGRARDARLDASRHRLSRQALRRHDLLRLRVRPLDEILGDQHLDARVPGIDELLQAASHIPTVVLSYGGPTITLAQLTSLVARHRRVQRALPSRMHISHRLRRRRKMRQTKNSSSSLPFESSLVSVAIGLLHLHPRQPQRDGGGPA